MTDDTVYYTLCPNNCWPEYCGLEITVREGQISRLRGNPHHPVSQGRLCAKGQAALDIMDSPRRLHQPLRRVGPRGSGAWHPISWDEALDIIAGRMRRSIEAGRPEANAIYHSHGNIVNKINWSLLTPRFANLCSLTLWSGDTVCWYDVGVGLRLTGYFGRDSIITAGESANAVLIWAHDSATSMTNSVPRLLKVRDRGGKLVVIDSRVTQTAMLADLHLQPCPGTDLILAGAMAQVLIEKGWIDGDFIATCTEGFEEYRQAVAGCTPAQAEEITGVPADDIVEAARIYGTAGPAVIDLSRGALGKQIDGWQTVRAIACLVGLCGYAGVPGGGMIWEGNIRLNNSLLAEDRRADAPYPPNHYGEIITSLEGGLIDTLLVWGANPLSQWPNLPRPRRALDRVKLVVVWDLFMNHTAAQTADIVLPATCWLEETGLKAGATHVYLMPKVLDPPAECKPGPWIQEQLASRLGHHDFFPWPDMESMLDDALDAPDCRGITVARLSRSPSGLPAPGAMVPPYSDHKFDTPGGKFAFHSKEAEALGLQPLPPFDERLRDEKGEFAGSHPLRLVSSRRSHQFHSFYNSNEDNSRLRQFEPTPVLHMHPHDAVTRGIVDGATVLLFNDRGRARLVVEWTTEVPMGVVSLSDGWPELNEVSNDDTSVPSSVTRALGMGGLPAYQETFVEVRPV